VSRDKKRETRESTRRGASVDKLVSSSADADFGRHARPKRGDERQRPERTRGKQREADRRRAARRAAQRLTAAKTARRYWLTPKAWNKRCSHCGHGSAVAVRPADFSHACADCVERLGITAHESTAWREGGAKVDPTVTVRFVEPRCDKPECWGPDCEELECYERDEPEPRLDYHQPYGYVRAQQLARAACEAAVRQAQRDAEREPDVLETGI
jgi:hypothetical protein